VIGFDDIPLAAMVTPPLTTVAAPTVLAGQAAVEGLLDRLEHKHKRRPHVGEIRTLPATLVVRGSTAAPPRLRRRRAPPGPDNVPDQGALR
jgi:DNA-binding LacI/PurR family transcriptional regulator